MSSLSSSVAAHCIQHVNGIVLNNSGGRSRKESLSSMKVISKVSDSGTGATVYYSYSFRHFSFVDTKQTRHTERTKWEKGEKHRDRESAMCGVYVYMGFSAGMSFLPLKTREKYDPLFPIEFSLFQ